MKKFVKILVAIIIVLGVQVIGSLLFIYPCIIHWGANDSEISMSMPGDKYAGAISATRAIDIHRPKADVWACLVDLGADRRGFYSFTLLESLYGCEIASNTDTSNLRLKVGRLIPTTSPDAHGNYKVGFIVLEVEQGQSFVLNDWGTFLIKEIDKNNSRLIIRTNSKAPHNLIEKFGYSVFEMLHYVMERRMMTGIKDYAETKGLTYTETSDWIWILCIFVSGMAGLFMIFVFKKYHNMIIPTIVFILWQLVFFVLNPKPFYGIMLVILVGTSFFLYRRLLKTE